MICPARSYIPPTAQFAQASWRGGRQLADQDSCLEQLAGAPPQPTPRWVAPVGNNFPSYTPPPHGHIAELTSAGLNMPNYVRPMPHLAEFANLAQMPRRLATPVLGRVGGEPETPVRASASWTPQPPRLPAASNSHQEQVDKPSFITIAAQRSQESLYQASPHPALQRHAATVIGSSGNATIGCALGARVEVIGNDSAPSITAQSDGAHAGLASPAYTRKLASPRIGRARPVARFERAQISTELGQQSGERRSAEVPGEPTQHYGGLATGDAALFEGHLESSHRSTPGQEISSAGSAPSAPALAVPRVAESRSSRLPTRSESSSRRQCSGTPRPAVSQPGANADVSSPIREGTQGCLDAPLTPVARFGAEDAQSIMDQNEAHENAYLRKNIEHLRHTRHQLKRHVGGLQNRVHSLEVQLQHYKALSEQMQPSSGCPNTSEMEITSLQQQLSAVQLLSDALNKENLDLQQQLRDAKSTEGKYPKHSCACVICLDNLANIVCLPCKHLALCTFCAQKEKVDICPICRSEIRDQMQIFMP